MTEAIIKEEEKKKGLLKEGIGKVTGEKTEELKGTLEHAKEEVKKKVSETEQKL